MRPRRRGFPPPTSPITDHNITAPLAHHARAYAGKPALVQGGRTVSYGELDRLVRQAAAQLRKEGLVQGQVAGVALRDSIEHIVLLCALARSGVVILPLDWRWTGAEQERVLEHFGAAATLIEADGATPARFRPLAVGAAFWEAARRQPVHDDFPADDLPLLMSLSSGTTGRPKGPRLRHSQFIARYRVFSINLGFNSQDRFLAATPLYFGGGRTFALALLYIGGTLYMLPPPYDASELCRSVERWRITSLFLVPTLIRRLSVLPDADLAPLRGLRLLLSSGSSLHAHERAEIRRRMCPAFIEYYSSTEGGGVSLLTREDPEEFSASVGRPVFGVDVECVDDSDRALPSGEVGRIRYRGPAVADGFWNDPEATGESFRDGWWYPGDLGMIDRDGYLHLRGRAKDMIIRGGVNIYPAEIEAVLLSHPAVADAAVLGWPSREFNEEVAAFVIPRAGRRADPPELRSLCRERLAPYKIPREIFLVREFPRNTLGKVIKSELGRSLPAL